MHVTKDGETFQLGELQIEVLHTPGHTLESTCYLLKNPSGKDHCVFTGDTLFVGDVGRPDLAQKGSELTMNDLAGMMYDSIQNKIMKLADDVIVYPAHSANLPSSPTNTAPGMKPWKSAGNEIDMVIDVEADELAMDLPFDPRILVLDVRRPAEFADGHVKEAMNLPLEDMKDPALLADFEEDQNIYVHCAGGYRSVIATSLLKRQGIHNLRNVVGGWNKIKEESKIPTEKEKTVLN